VSSSSRASGKGSIQVDSISGVPVGSCGSAAYYGKPILAEALDTDPRWRPYKARPLEVGLKACWSTPIKAKDGRVIGTFAFYFRESRAPSRWHQRIVEACVHLGALAIERKEARAQIARLAYHDMLTGLPNRTQLRQLLNQAIDDCKGRQLALIFLVVGLVAGLLGFTSIAGVESDDSRFLARMSSSGFCSVISEM